MRRLRRSIKARALAATGGAALAVLLLLAGCGDGTTTDEGAIGETPGIDVGLESGEVDQQMEATDSSIAEPTSTDGAGEAPVAGEASAPTAVAMATEQALEGLPTAHLAFGVEGIDPGQILLPFDVAVDGEGNIHVSDSKGVQKFSPSGEFIHQVGAGELPVAQGIDVSADGIVYVAGFGEVVLVYDADGSRIGSIGEAGAAPGQTTQPVDVALDVAGNIYVVDTGTYRVEKFAPDGTHLLGFGERGTMSGQFTAPRVIAVDGEGRVYVAMGDDFLIQRFSPDGEYIDTFGHSHAEENMWRIAGLAVDDFGRLYASRAIGHMIQSFDSETRALEWEYGTLGQEAAQFNTPGGLDVAGNLLYVADTANNRIQVLLLDSANSP